MLVIHQLLIPKSSQPNQTEQARANDQPSNQPPIKSTAELTDRPTKQQPHHQSTEELTDRPPNQQMDATTG